MNKRILCAALHIDNGLQYTHNPKNIQTGCVIVGRRHCDAFQIISLSTIFRAGANIVEGFLTTDNYFVDRAQAAHIAFASGQITKEVDELLSEHLY